MTDITTIPEVEVTPEGRYIVPCAGCGVRHTHGAGPNPYGARGVHCASKHKPFREDCEPVADAGRKVCRVVHIPGMVELVPVRS